MASALSPFHRGNVKPTVKACQTLCFSDEVKHKKGEVRCSQVTNALGRGEGKGISKPQACNN